MLKNWIYTTINHFNHTASFFEVLLLYLHFRMSLNIELIAR